MAKHVNVVLVDDIDGSQASETVSFGLDGRQYDIDLSANHATHLRDALASYAAAARRPASGTGRRSTAPRAAQSTNNQEQLTAVREWAKANGQPISDRGRISKVVMQAYENRGSQAVPAAAPVKKSRKRSQTAEG